MEIGRLFITIGTKLDQFNKGMSDVDTALTKIGTKCQTAGKNLTKYITLPLIALGGAAVKVGADFEQSLVNAFSVTGSSSEEVRQKMEDLASSMGDNTVFSANQAAQALYYLASAGYKVKDMENALGPILNLAAATQNDLAFATDTVVASLNQFQLGSAGAERVTNVFAAAISNSQATLDKLQESMRYVGPVFHSLNMPIEEASAALMVLYNAGYDASMAGTALRMALVRLSEGTEGTKSALAEMGLTMQDVDPQSHSLADIIEKLEEKQLNFNQAVRIFGARAAPAMLAMVTQGSQKMKDFEQTITGTNSATRMASLQTDTFKGSMKLLRNALEKAATEISKILSPAIRDLVDNKIKPAVQWFSKLSTETKTTIVKIAGLAAAMGPLLYIFGKFLIILPKIKVALAAMSGPFGIVIAGIISATKTAKTANDAFKSMDKTIRDMELVTGEKISGIEKLWYKVNNAVSKVTLGIDDAKLVQQKYNKELTELDEKIKNMPDIFGLGQEAVGWLNEKLKEGVDLLKKMQEGEGGKGGIEGNKQAMVELGETIVESSSGVVAEIGWWGAELIGLQSIIENTMETLQTEIYETGIPAARDMGGVLEQVVSDMEEDTEGFRGAVEKKIKTDTNSVSNIWDEMADGIKTKWINELSAALQGAKSFKDALKGVWDTIKSQFFDMIAKMITKWIVNFLGNLLSSTKSATAGVADSFKGLADSISSSMSAAASAINIVGTALIALIGWMAIFHGMPAVSPPKWPSQEWKEGGRGGPIPEWPTMVPGAPGWQEGFTGIVATPITRKFGEVPEFVNIQPLSKMRGMSQQQNPINFNVYYQPHVSAIDAQDTWRFISGPGLEAFKKIINSNFAGFTRELKRNTENY